MRYSISITQARKSKFYISIWPDCECTNSNYKNNTLAPLKIVFIELHIRIIYLAYTDRYHKKWLYCVYYGVSAHPLYYTVCLHEA